MKDKIILLKINYIFILDKIKFLDDKVIELTNLIESFYKKQIIDENDLISKYIVTIQLYFFHNILIIIIKNFYVFKKM